MRTTRQAAFPAGLLLVCLAATGLGDLTAQTRTPAPRYYPNRWVFVFLSLQTDADVEQIREIARTASAHDLNGMVLTGGLSMLDRQDAAYFRRLDQVRQIASDNSLEIIPTLFSAGYGGAVLGRNPNLAEGLPVKDALFVVSGGQAKLQPEPAVSFTNGGFEQYSGNNFPGFVFHDRPGEVSFADTRVFHGGRASIRFENFGNFEYGHGRLMQELQVHPYRCYRVSAWVRTESLSPSGAFNFLVLDTNSRELSYMTPPIQATGDWSQVHIGFNSGASSTVRIYAGVWEGKSGRFWLDDLEIRATGLTNVLRRPGTPVAVRGETSGVTYAEGSDYGFLADPQLNFRFDHDGPAIRIPAGSRIREGERLRVSWYHGMSIYQGQVSLCMSEPELYEIWEDQARRLHEKMAPRRYLLSADEIRMGGTCEACRSRGMTMAQILGDSITRQVQILRGLNPAAEILTWSDMLDPNHNAVPNYYLVDGDYTGSWEYVPRDLGIMCWYYDIRRESLAHFSRLGFRTFAAAYYDADTLDNPAGWLDALDETPGAEGILYTTWENKYGLLGPFGDLVSHHWRRMPVQSPRDPRPEQRR
jgi:hypothetical protein